MISEAERERLERPTLVMPCRGSVAWHYTDTETGERIEYTLPIVAMVYSPWNEWEYLYHDLSYDRPMTISAGYQELVTATNTTDVGYVVTLAGGSQNA